MLDEHHTACRLAQMLATARLEVIPLAGIMDRVVDAVPQGTTLTVTCSPRHGMERTVETAEFLSAKGYEVIPHIAASAVRDRRHLAKIAIKLSDIGVTEVFVIGGDAQTGAGVYTSSLELIEELVELRNRPARIGVAGYPEGHPDIPDGVLAEALQRKAQHASYIVPQMCFAPAALHKWFAWLAEIDVALPVVLGVPGAVMRRKLMEMAPRMGVGSSVRYLSKNRKAMSKLLLRRTYTPELLLQDVMATRTAAARVSGLHIFTFNQLTETEEWRSRQQGSWRQSAQNATPSVNPGGGGFSCCLAGDASGADPR